MGLAWILHAGEELLWFWARRGLVAEPQGVFAWGSGRKKEGVTDRETGRWNERRRRQRVQNL